MQTQPHFWVCRYKGRQIDDRLIPGGQYIITPKIGAFPRIQDAYGCYVIAFPGLYELIDEAGNPLSADKVAEFLDVLTADLAVR
jgi:hypothetical protein